MWDIPKLDKNDNPCFKCDKRHATCHASCRAYIEWCEQHQKNKKKQRLKKYNDNVGAPNVHNPNYNNN